MSDGEAKFEKLSFGGRRLFHVIIQGKERRILPIYLHYMKEHLNWMTENSHDILKELSEIILDNLELLQQQYHDIENNEQASRPTPLFYRLRGETISIAYKIQKRMESWCSLLVPNEFDSRSYHVIPKASFVLNPLYIFPYGTYPLLPGPSKTLSIGTTTTITEYYQMK
jgi:hypothetical protein